MVYLSSYRWFSNVYCYEMDEIFDCLVEVGNVDIGYGHILIEEQNRLIVYPAEQILSKLPHKNMNLIGRAIKWGKSF